MVTFREVGVVNIGKRGVRMSKTLITDRRRASLLILIMVGIAIGVAGMTISVLYKAAFDQERERLVETAQSQARLVETVARFDDQYSAVDNS
ncbi:MAG: hypothetical protein ACE5HX_06190 [bacterium]